MASSTVQKVYAEGLYRAALARKEADAVGEELAVLAEVLSPKGRFRSFLSTPAVTAEEKRQSLRRMLAGRVSGTTLQFLLVLVDKRRLAFISGIAAEYQRLLDAGNGILRGEMQTAHAADGGLRSRLERALSAHFDRNVALVERTRPELLGGALVQVGDFVVDGTFRTKLKVLRRRLTAGQGI